MNRLQTLTQPILQRIRAFDRPGTQYDMPISRESQVTVKWVVGLLWFIVLTEKVAVPPLNVEVCFFAGLFVVAALFWQKLIYIDPGRAAVFLGVVALMLMEQILTQFRETESAMAIIAVLGYYIVFIFVAPIEREARDKILEGFSSITIFIAFMVYMDWVFNLLHHAPPNLDKILPEPFQFLHYVYVQPIHWGSPYMKPNGFFMLEASVTCQVLGMGIVAEFCTRQNLLRLAILVSAMLMTFAATGYLLLIGSIPFLLRRTKVSTLVVGLMLFPLVLGAAEAGGLIKNFMTRTSEFHQQGASGNQRFVWPYQLTAKQLAGDVHDAFLGVGAGNSADDSRLPIVIKGKPNGAPGWGTPTKLIVEYGLPIGFIWTAFFMVLLFRSPMPAAMAVAMFIQYEFLNGAFIVPQNILYCYLLVIMYVKPNPAWRVMTRQAPTPAGSALSPAQ